MLFDWRHTVWTDVASSLSPHRSLSSPAHMMNGVGAVQPVLNPLQPVLSAVADSHSSQQAASAPRPPVKPLSAYMSFSKAVRLAYVYKGVYKASDMNWTELAWCTSRNEMNWTVSLFALHSLLLKDKYVPREVKVIIFTTILRPILMHGCEARTLTCNWRSKVQAAEMRVLRLIRGVTLRDRLRNTDIRLELGIKGILRYVAEMQLRWYGHVKRMPDGRLPRRMLHWRPNSTRPPVDHASAGSTTPKRLCGVEAEVERSCLFDDRRCWRGFTDRPSAYL